MSTTLEAPTHPWNTRPGWGISVDLTPREILSARQRRVHKRLIGAGLVLVVVVCTGFTMMTLDDKSAAERSYEAALTQTSELQAEAAQYDEITLLLSITSEIEAETATLMATDVDFTHLLALVRVGLTPHLALTSETVLLTPTVVAPPPPPADTSAGEDPAAVPPVAAPVGPQVIGSVSLAGTGNAISDLAPFIAVLNHLPGVVDVVPTSTTTTETGMAFTLSMNITDELYTHRFDLDGGS